MRRSLLLLFGVAVSLLAAAAQSADYVAMSGQELYSRFCASCHGATGHGDGAVSKSIRVEVPDLTLVTRRAGGKYPRQRIVQIIDGRHTGARVRSGRTVRRESGPLRRFVGWRPSRAYRPQSRRAALQPRRAPSCATGSPERADRLRTGPCRFRCVLALAPTR